MAVPTIAEVDAFIAGYKALDGLLGVWRQNRGYVHEARWGVVDAMQVRQAELIFTLNSDLTDPTIIMTFQRQLIYRVDIVADTECKWNDYGAKAEGLPSNVCGPHTHPWCEHRRFISENGFGELPYRKPLDIADTTFIRALEVVAADMNIDVTAEQRSCCQPPRQGGLPFGSAR